jgi:hypothetical protein
VSNVGFIFYSGSVEKLFPHFLEFANGNWKKFESAETGSNKISYYVFGFYQHKFFTHFSLYNLGISVAVIFMLLRRFLNEPSDQICLDSSL